MRRVPLLEILGVRKAFGGLVALNRVDLSLPKGGIWALIGPNGAGKTTLFNLITGHLQGDEGSVLFQGRPIMGLPPFRIWSMGISRTFQIPSVFPSRTVFENVQTAVLSAKRKTLQFFKASETLFEEETRNLLKTVGLFEEREKFSALLSYGDLKKLELAMALANDPILLLLDEPTAGMAPLERGNLMGLVKGIAERRNLTVFFTEHDMDVVFSAAERIVVLHQGEVLAIGDPQEIRENAEVESVYLGKED